MFKVISAEIKKIVSRPGIYILSVLLAIILVLGVFIYEPTVYKNTSVELNGLNVLSKHLSFEGDTKPNVQEDITNTINAVKYYRIESDNGSITHKENIKNCLTTFEQKLQSYLECSNGTTGADTIISTIALPELISSLEDLNTAINTAVNKAKTGSYVVVTTEGNFKTYTSTYKEVYNLLKTSVDKDEIPNIVNEYNKKFKSTFINSINELNYPTLSNETIKDFSTLTVDSKLTIVYERLAEIELKIDEVVAHAQNGDLDVADYKYNLDPKKCDEIDALATEYVAVANTFTSLVNHTLISSAFSAVSVNDKLDLLYLKNESEYNSKSLVIRYSYLFEVNKTENSYAHPLTIGTSSNVVTNGYDYAYFILRLFSFLIIVYAVMVACNSIAGEVKEGTMRYYAIRPVSRTNIYVGKFLAIFLMSVIMLVFSAVIALCVGSTVYGLESLDILTIFNGSTCLTLKPIVMLGIYLLSFTFELLVYLTIAMLLSCLIKSDLFAVTVVLVLYLVNILLPMFVGGPNTWLTYYPFSHITLYSLFGSSVYALENDLFNQVLGVKIFAGTSIWLTATVISLIVIVLNILANKLFKNKEL